MVEAIVGATYVGKVNKKRIRVVSIQKDKFSGSQTVTYESLDDGKTFEYGLDAFNRCLIECTEVV